METSVNNKYKAFTSLEQSKKLTEILPIESADMCYRIVAYNPNDTYEYQPYCFVSTLESDIPCWSLSALLDVLPQQYYPIKNIILGKPKDKWCVLYWDATGMQDGEQTLGDNPIDACYEMILKLHEQKLL